MANETQTEIALSIKAALFEPAPWHKPWAEVEMMIMSHNMRRGVAGRPSPIAAKALKRIAELTK